MMGGIFARLVSHLLLETSTSLNTTRGSGVSSENSSALQACTHTQLAFSRGGGQNLERRLLQHFRVLLECQLVNARGLKKE